MNQETNSNKVPFRVRVGVTGHRDIQLNNKLKTNIQTALTESIQKVINPKRKNIITPLSYQIITPLADGADRILAAEAINILSAEIEAVLPMTQEEYVKTFYPDKPIEDFQNILARATKISSLITIPLEEQFPGEEIDRRKHLAFKKNSEYIIDNSDILIVLWNGKKSEGICGTFATLNYARQKKKSIIIIFTNAPHEIKMERGDDFLRSSFERFEFFNSYEITSVEEQIYTNNVIKDHFSNTQKILNPDNINIAQEKLIPHYVRASKIAKKYQSLYQNTGMITYILSTLSVSVVALGILFHHLSWLFYLTEFILLLTILSIIYFADRCKAHKKWIQNRFLSEQIRTAIYFISCGFKPLQIKIPSHLHLAHRPNDWMVKVYNEIIKNLSDIPSYKSDDYKPLLEYIKVYWILNQLDYHKNNSVKMGKKNKNLELMGGIVFVVALVAAAVHTILIISGFEFQYEWISDYIIFAAISLPALGATLGAIRNHREYSRIEKRSENTVALLEELYKECENVKSMKDLKNLLDNLEEVMVNETQDWLMLMKFVKLEVR